MLADDLLTSAAEQTAEYESDDDDVVELPGDWNEIRHEVERKREVAGKRDEQQLLSAWNAGVAEQPAAEHDAVWDEGCEGAGTLPSACKHKREQERGVNEQEHANSKKRQGPDAHVTTVPTLIEAAASLDPGSQAVSSKTRNPATTAT
jgi:hypothetical protein